MNMDKFEALYEAIQMRPRPEDVAELILEIAPELYSDKELAVLNKAAAYSLKRMAHRYSSMKADFSRPVGPEKAVRVAQALFTVEAPLSAVDCFDAEKVEAFVRSIEGQIGHQYGRSDFKTDRLNREARKTAGVEHGKRAYNKRFRLLARLEDKIKRVALGMRKYKFTRYSKSALAVELPIGALRQDLATACFVAELSSRMSLRSVFTNTSQVRAFDEVSAMLYKRATRSDTVNWWAIAHVHPEQEVLNHLTEDQRGQLLGVAYEVLHDVGELLGEMFGSLGVERSTLIVRRGADSSTWNQAAGAWNKARDLWFALLGAMGMESVLDEVCPGKALRLMAADVARWHGALHPDTHVWAALPLPWEVLRGEQQCTRFMVANACKLHGVPLTGWAGPKSAKRAVEFTPTPELVHGVTVSSPLLAAVLRKAGVFSGKVVTDPGVPFTVKRDEQGAALSVEP
jgi:hypothetical protein